MMPPTPPLRERLESIRDEAQAFLRQTLPDSAYNPAVGTCERIHEDAVAALAHWDALDDLLDDIRLDIGTESFAGARRQADNIRAIQALLGDADPLVPRLDANPNTKEDT